MTKVLFIDNGIEFDSLVLREKPFGGAEVAFVSLVESLAKLGLKVTVYNNCINEGFMNGVKWKRIGKELEYEDFEVLFLDMLSILILNYVFNPLIAFSILFIFLLLIQL